jgi:membrane protein
MGEKMAYLRARLGEAIHFIRADVWRIRARTLPRSKSFLIRQLRIILLALRGFRSDKCSLRASALTFFSILSIVPAVAMAFGVAKGFGLEKRLEQRLLSALAGHQEVATRIVEFSRSLLENASGGLIAGVGVAVLLWTVLKLLSNIERSFNEIWGIQRHRPLARKFADYLSLVLICPFLVVVSGSVTVVVTAKVGAVVDSLTFLGFVGTLLHAMLKLLPYCIGWGLFAFVYVFLPNTKVQLSSGLLAGIVAGTLYQLVQWAYVSLQIGVTRYSAIYGSFAVLPLFLIWLQATWLVVLFGAELAFAHQNVETYEFEPDCLGASRSFRRLVALRIAQIVVSRFADGEPPLTAAELSHELGVPIRLTNELLYELQEADVLSEVRSDGEQEPAYQPARSVDSLTVGYVIEALDREGTDTVPLAESRELEMLADCLEQFAEAIRNSAANVPLRDI